jgi:hypothetical protein
MAGKALNKAKAKVARLMWRVVRFIKCLLEVGGHDIAVCQHFFKSFKLSLWDKPLVFYRPFKIKWMQFLQKE